MKTERRRYLMNQDILTGKWKQKRGQVKQWWGKLTDDDLDRIDGAMDKLAGALQERYGWERDQVEREMKKRFDRYDEEMRDPARRQAVLEAARAGGPMTARSPFTS